MSNPHDDDPDRDPPDYGSTEDSSAHDEVPDEPGELDPEEVDKRFAELIAHFHDAATPELEDGDTTPEPENDLPPLTPSAPKEDDRTLLDLWDEPLPEDPDDPEENYVPPPPPPVPRPSAPAVIGVLLVLGGLALIVSPMLLNTTDTIGRLGGIAALLGGAWMLVWRLRPEPDEDDDDYGSDDNGAIV